MNCGNEPHPDHAEERDTAMMNRRHLLTAAACAAWTRGAWAQTEPGKVLFGLPPGGLGGELGTELTQLLAKRYTPVSYEFTYVSGGASMRALEVTKTAANNGRTLLQAQSAQLSLVPLAQRKAMADPNIDLAPVALIGTYTWCFAVGPAVPAEVKTMADYLRWVGDNPEWRNYGVTLFGSQGHLTGLLMARDKGLSIRAQNYAGTGTMLKDLANQSLAAGFVIIGNGRDQFASGALRPLAVMGDARWPSLQAVPTFKELQLPSVDTLGWYGWFAPPALPRALQDELSAAVNNTLTSPEGTALLQRLQLGGLI